MEVILLIEILDMLTNDKATPGECEIVCDENNKNLIKLAKGTDQTSLLIMYVLCTKFNFTLPQCAMIFFQRTMNTIYNKKQHSEFDLFFLASMYRSGVVVNINYQKAAEFYEKAVDQYKSPEAVTALAFMLRVGQIDVVSDNCKKQMIALANMLENSQIGVLPDQTPNLRSAKELYESAGATESLEKLNQRLENDIWRKQRLVNA